MKEKKKKRNTRFKPKCFDPIGDHYGGLEAAMGVYQCGFRLFRDRGFTGRLVGVKTGECLDRGVQQQLSRDPFLFLMRPSLHMPLTHGSVNCFWVEMKAFSPARGAGGGIKKRDRVGGVTTWVGRVKSREGEEGQRLTKAQNDSRRVTQGSGASVSAPLPPLSHQKAWLPVLSLIYIYIYLDIDRYTHSFFFFSLQENI